MTQAEISGISPFFIVSHVPSSLSFYRDRLGFEITFQGPAPDDIFFGMVRRGGAQILLKDVGVAPLPNYKRDVKKGIARWSRCGSQSSTYAVVSFGWQRVPAWFPVFTPSSGIGATRRVHGWRAASTSCAWMSPTHRPRASSC